MISLSRLQQIIPPDQALANQALARAMLQIKNIFDTTLPELALAVQALQSNQGLPDIEDLTQPVPESVTQFWQTDLGQGTGVGNTFVLSDMLGVAAGNTIANSMPVATQGLQELTASGALDTIVLDTGNPANVVNGVFPVMRYVLEDAYTESSGTAPDPVQYTITIPAGLPGAGIYGPDPVIPYSQAMTNVVSNAQTRITAVVSSETHAVSVIDQGYDDSVGQLVINVTNCEAALIPIAAIVGNLANTDYIANSTSVTLSLATGLHQFALEVEPGGVSDFFTATANTQNIGGQAVVASLREGRNIQALGDAGVAVDTQIRV